MPLALNDRQLNLVMIAARAVDPSRRSIFLERVAAMLRVRHRFDDKDVGEVCKRHASIS
jgi:hypothetical protein